jgi:hypothetical protein
LIRRALRVAVLCSAFGCRPLPSIPEDECGNGVVESPEDCDGFPQNGIPCRPPGDVAQCRLDCTPRPSGEEAECPLRWGCDRQFVCRPPSGSYREVALSIEGNAWSLDNADFDGDERADILSLEPPGALGYTKIRAHFLDPALGMARTWVSKKTLATPEILGPSTRGEHAGLVFSDFNINVWRGESDGTLAPESYSTYYLERTKARLLPVADRAVADQTPLVLLTESPDEFGLYRPDPSREQLVLITELPGSLAELAADPAVGDLFEDDQRYPCADLALAYRGAVEVRIYSVCGRDEAGELTWREPDLTTVALDPPTPIVSGPIIADIDGDGHLDLLVGAGPRGDLFVARGDGTRFDAARTRLGRSPELPEEAPFIVPMPLAAGDVTNDGLAELIYPEEIFFSRPPVGETSNFAIGFTRFRAFWSVARVADFNGDGELDIAAASEEGVDVDFFSGTGTDQVNPFTISTTRPVRHLGVGDVDGDLLADLILAQVGVGYNEDEVSVAFGSFGGPPDAPVTVAHASKVQQLVTVVDNVEGNNADLVLLYEREDESGSAGSAIAVLPGAGDRSLPCPVALTTFEEDDSLVSAPSVATTPGSFLDPDEVDVLALGLVCDDPLVPCQLGERSPELWLLPDLESGTRAPRRLGWPSGLPTSAVQMTPTGGADVRVALRAVDLDGDRRDEVMLGTADASRERCVLATARLSEGAGARVRVLSNLVLPEPCTQGPLLRAMDLDGDDAEDVVVLSGQPGPRLRLRVLWNDGGRFDLDRAEELLARGESPQSFALFPASPTDRPRIAVVTETRVRWIEVTGASRGLREGGIPPETSELVQGTGVTAADFDGDRITDLAVADSGLIRIFQAELEPR